MLSLPALARREGGRARPDRATPEAGQRRDTEPPEQGQGAGRGRLDSCEHTSG